MSVELARGNMNPFFTQCSVPSIRYLRGQAIENLPINLSLCTAIKKFNFAWYPDNVGRPAIRFLGCDLEWVFDKDVDRDIEYDRILQIQNPVDG